MTFKTILVHVETTPESDLRLAMASSLARELGATLAGVGGCAPAYTDNHMLSYTDGMVAQALTDQAAMELWDSEARFRRLTHSLGKKAVWLTDEEYPDRALEICAAGADLIVTSAGQGATVTTAVAADLVMRVGIPILTIPSDLPAIRTQTIVVAWQNTLQARRAVTDALPLLKKAKQVFVCDVCVAAETRPAWSGLQAVVARLKRNGVHAKGTEVSQPQDVDVADVLISFSGDHLADLIVAGAYGHARAVEWILGGVTQGLLERSTLPILFSR